METNGPTLWRCFSPVLWRDKFVGACYELKKSTCPRILICVVRIEMRQWAPTSLIFTLCMILSYWHAGIYMNQYVKLGMSTGKGGSPYFDVVISGIRLWSMLSPWWKHFKAQKLLPYIITWDLTHSRKHMGRREDVIAEVRMLLFFRSKWLLYVTVIDIFNKIFTASYKLCLFPILVPWAGVIIFHGKARNKIHRVLDSSGHFLPNKHFCSIAGLCISCKWSTQITLGNERTLNLSFLYLSLSLFNSVAYLYPTIDITFGKIK